MFMKKDVKENKGKTPVAETRLKSKENDRKVIFPLESFIVNLMDKAGAGKRYLKTTIELEVAGETEKKMVTNYKVQIRDTVLILLTGQSFNEIRTVEGKIELKQGLLARINQTLGKGIVQRLYFTEFVVQ